MLIAQRDRGHGRGEYRRGRGRPGCNAAQMRLDRIEPSLAFISAIPDGRQADQICDGGQVIDCDQPVGEQEVSIRSGRFVGEAGAAFTLQFIAKVAYKTASEIKGQIGGSNARLLDKFPQVLKHTLLDPAAT